MLSNLLNKPTSDTLTLSQIDQLNELIQTRISLIDRSGDYLGHVKCYVNPNQPNVIYTPKHEQPLVNSTFVHPISRRPCAVLSHINQAGWVGIEFLQFDSSVDFFTVTRTYDFERARHFSRLIPTGWKNIPCTLDTEINTAILPLAYRPDCGDILLYRNSIHFKVISVLQEQTCNLCQIQIQEVN